MHNAYCWDHCVLSVILIYQRIKTNVNVGFSDKPLLYQIYQYIFKQILSTLKYSPLFSIGPLLNDIFLIIETDFDTKVLQHYHMKHVRDLNYIRVHSLLCEYNVLNIT